MKLFKDIYKFLLGEQVATNKDGVPKYLSNSSSRPDSIANAVKKRHPVSFFYNGPRSKVQPSRRVKAEMVALGLSKKGNMIVRAWVEPPSRTKSGFEKGNWRTFMVGRMNQIEIFDQETFDEKRPGYKDGDDNSMSVTYVTPNWSDTPQVTPQDTPQVEPTQTKPEEPQKKEPIEPQSTEPERTELPQPEPENRPSMEPPVVDDEDENEDEDQDNNYDGLNEDIKRIKQLLYN